MGHPREVARATRVSIARATRVSVARATRAPGHASLPHPGKWKPPDPNRQRPPPPSGVDCGANRKPHEENLPYMPPTLRNPHRGCCSTELDLEWTHTALWPFGRVRPVVKTNDCLWGIQRRNRADSSMRTCGGCCRRPHSRACRTGLPFTLRVRCLPQEEGTLPDMTRPAIEWSSSEGRPPAAVSTMLGCLQTPMATEDPAVWSQLAAQGTPPPARKNFGGAYDPVSNTPDGAGRL